MLREEDLSTTDVSILADEQVAAFDEEYVCDGEWEILKVGLDARFRDRPFRFLDVGGGTGRFADRLLDTYPEAQGVVLDNASLLLRKNGASPRKALQLASAGDLSRVFAGERFDLVVFNWVLHHMVTSGYQRTRRLQAQILAQASGLLTADGVVSISENIYDGILGENVPGRLIYGLTSSTRLAPLTARLGANTAGVGVCFLSRKEIQADAERCGLKLVHYRQGFDKELPLARRLLLQVRAAYHGHFLFEAGPVRPRNQLDTRTNNS